MPSTHCALAADATATAEVCVPPDSSNTNTKEQAPESDRGHFVGKWVHCVEPICHNACSHADRDLETYVAALPLHAHVAFYLLFRHYKVFNPVHIMAKHEKAPDEYYVD